MKKFLSISFSLIIFLSVMHFTIAIHYCGGEFAGAKVSFSGELASCMEGADDQCPLSGKHIGNHCCDDKVSVFAVDNNYAPSFIGFKAFSQHIHPGFNIPANTRIQSISVLNHICTSVSPPGCFMVNAVSLPDICVFRI